MLTLSNITEVIDMAEYKAGPRKRPPTHPGLIVASTLERLGVSIRTAAAAMGVTAGALSNLTTGKAAVSPEMAVRLGAYLGNGPELWLNLQADYDIWHARAALAGEVARIKPAEEAA